MPLKKLKLLKEKYLTKVKEEILFNKEKLNFFCIK